MYGGIDIDKTSKSKDCNIRHHWNFLDKGFKFQPNVCNGCHHVLMMSINDIGILNIQVLITVVLLTEIEKVKP